MRGGELWSGAMIKASTNQLRSRRRTVGIFGTNSGMMRFSRVQIIRGRAMYRKPWLASSIWFSMATGSIPLIMAESGIRAAYLQIGRLIARVLGGGVTDMAGPGSRTRSGAGSRIIMGDGHIIRIVGAGCPAGELIPAGRGIGPRIMSPFLAGAIKRIVGTCWDGVRSRRVKHNTAARENSTTFAVLSTLYETTVRPAG
jgi:hypothetical protein